MSKSGPDRATDRHSRDTGLGPVAICRRAQSGWNERSADGPRRRLQGHARRGGIGRPVCHDVLVGRTGQLSSCAAEAACEAGGGTRFAQQR